ncbi:peptidoglycan-binding protein [Parafrankia sp. EUN1f]|uniref:peptidoglycan-binding domain-containing protein n=1 Tax=Parafrankia sp. EUN1f TaxID=102897 RepID=UPI0001C4396E|nr:peptidoglycan-binding domain-containing protein [Parafrankia sp. EUN1f]EFC85917.1 Peptidoglycan-binding domain 1 protein [Parafrankia sp. EUN1f]
MTNQFKALLTDVRIGGHPDFDRVVIEWDGPRPTVDVRYVPEVFQDGSGDRIPLKGRAFLHVTLRPADSVDDNGNPTVTLAPPDIRDLAALRQVTKPDVFEGIAGWGIGVAARTPFEVRPFESPSRIAIDVTHTPPGTGNQLLQVGAFGAAVATWQWRLRLALHRDLTVDEAFGPLTQAATRDFQSSHGLVVDGVVGPVTRARMRSALSL